MTTTLAVLEQRDGVLRKISHEVVTGAQRLGGTVEAVVCASGDVRGSDQLGKFGADKIVTLTNAVFANYAPEACALCQQGSQPVKPGSRHVPSGDR